MNMLSPRVTLFHRETTQSTNEDAKAAAQNGAPHLSLFTADFQSAGKGRSGRQWVSPKGNLFFSLLIRIQPNWENIGTLSHLSALAVRETIVPLLPDYKVQLKWPNDVLVTGHHGNGENVNAAKICGILLEMIHVKSPIDHQPTPHIIAGIGVNITHHPTGDEMLYDACSLASLGVDVKKYDRDYIRAALADNFLNLLDQWTITGFNAIKDQYTENAYRIGKDITVKNQGANKGQNQDQELQGIYQGITNQGALILKTKKEEHIIHAGDVFGI